MRLLILIPWVLCAASAQDITEAWTQVLAGSTAPSTHTTATTPAAPPTDDFLNHLFLNTRTEYIREAASFTGMPALTGVINETPGSASNPNGIPYPAAFQPNANTMYTFLDFGTRGWLSPNVDSDFSMRYRQDLTNVNPASPDLNLLNTFPGERKFDLLTANVDVHGADMDLRVGRQALLGAELAQFDGASFSLKRKRFAFTLYGGRRYALYSDPLQRGIGGGNFRLILDDNSSVEYDALLYIRLSQSLTFRRRLGHHWFASTFFRMVGGYPVDLNSQALYTSKNGKSSARFSFAQKITNKDYIYDYTLPATDLDPHNPQTRLYLGLIQPYSQFTADYHRTLLKRLRAGGSIWIRRLDHASDQSAFNTSFNEYRADMQAFPFSRIEALLSFQQHNSLRGSPLNAATFDDISTTGETRIQNFTAELRRSFDEGRLSLGLGGYYQRLNFQDQFLIIQNAHNRGLLGSAWYRLTPQTRLFFNYSLDTDFYIFNPDIRHSTVMRIGVDWKL